MSLVSKTADKNDLHMVLNEKRGMSEVHKQALEAIRSDIERQLEEQKEKI